VVRSIGVAAFLALAACATAGERVPPEGLRISARDAEQTAYTRAVTWASDAVLRYVEGEAVAADGYVLPGQGAWRFIYGSAGREDELVVTVTPTTIEQEARPRQSPPGFALGDAALDDGWIDSPRALAMTGAGADGSPSSRPDATVSMLLVPLRPAQWLIRGWAGGEARQWSVDARTGALLAVE